MRGKLLFITLALLSLLHATNSKACAELLITPEFTLNDSLSLESSHPYYQSWKHNTFKNILKLYAEAKTDTERKAAHYAAAELAQKLLNEKGLESRKLELPESYRVQILMPQKPAQKYAHWLSQLATGMTLKGFFLTLDTDNLLNTAVYAYFSKYDKIVSLPWDVLLASSPTQVTIHELVHYKVYQDALKDIAFVASHLLPPESESLYRRSILFFRPDGALEEPLKSSVYEKEHSLDEVDAWLKTLEVAWFAFPKITNPFARHHAQYNMKRNIKMIKTMIKTALQDFDEILEGYFDVLTPLPMVPPGAKTASHDRSIKLMTTGNTIYFFSAQLNIQEGVVVESPKQDRSLDKEAIKRFFERETKLLKIQLARAIEIEKKIQTVSK